MALLRNKSYFGDLDVPALGRFVLFGDTVEINTDDDLVAQMLAGGHFEEVDADGNVIEPAPAADDDADKEPETDPVVPVVEQPVTPEPPVAPEVTVEAAAPAEPEPVVDAAATPADEPAPAADVAPTDPEGAAQ